MSRFGVLCRELVVGLLLIGGIGSCTVDQAKEQAKYREILRPPASQPVAQLGPDEGLSLERALQLTNDNNERLSISGENYLQALIEKDRAAARFLPTLNLVPSYVVSDPASGQSVASTGSLDVPMSGNINVFNGFQDVANLRRTRFNIAQQRALLLDLQANILLSVAQTYYEILSAEGSAEVLANSLKVQEERVRDIEARQRVGTARPLDVAQTQAQAAATRVAFVRARTRVANGRSALAFLVGAPVISSRLLDQFDAPPTILPLKEAIATARKERQDLKAASAAVLAARQTVSVAIGQYFPTVALNVEYFLYRESLPTETQWTALLSANVPIFSAGVIRANVRSAWSQWRQARFGESLIDRQVEQDVRIAYENLLSSQEELTELAIQLTAAREAFRQAEESYNVGFATNLERLSAQDQLLSAELQLTNEQFTRKISYLNLLRVIGQFSTQLPPETLTTQPTTVPAPTTLPWQENPGPVPSTQDVP